MTIYLIISCITLCLCRITYLWVRHKREQPVDAEQQIEDAISPYIEEEITSSWDQYTCTCIGNITCEACEDQYNNYRRMRALRNAIIPYDEVRQTQALHIKTDKEDFTPKKRMKVHKLDQGIRKETIRIHSPIGPGVYTREVDRSTVISSPEYWTGIVRRNREND